MAHASARATTKPLMCRLSDRLIGYRIIYLRTRTVGGRTLARRKGLTRTSLGYQAKLQVNAYVDIKQ